MNATQIICLIFIILISMVIGRRTKKPKYPIIGEIDLNIPAQVFYAKNIEELRKFSNNSYVVLKVKSRQNHPI